jgi:small-conductance mechanosensitive channel
MPKRYVLFFLALILMAALGLPNPVPAASAKSPAETVSIPAGATPEQVRDVMSGLTDEQVRSLLMEELKAESARQAASARQKKHGLAALLHEVHVGTDLLRERFEYLFSGAVTAPAELPKTLRTVMGSDTLVPPGKLILAVAVLTALWLGGMFLFRRKSVAARKAISRLPEDAYWFERMGRLFLRALLDLFGVVLVGVLVLACYLGLFNQGAASRPVIIAWLGAMVFLALVKIAARFLLAPHAPSLRYLPLSDKTAQYLFRWTVNLGRIMAAGLLITSLIRLDQGSEALFLLTSALFGSLIAFVLVLMVLWNKKPVADFLRANHSEDSFLYAVADVWQVGGIAYVLGFWLFWLLALVVFGTRAMLPGLVTLLAVPGYFLLDWATQRLVSFAVALAAESTESGGEEPGEEGEEPRGITRFQSFLSKGFRVLILAATGFTLLRVWGLDVSLGRATVRASLSILTTLVLAYIFWIFLSSLIERKLMDKQKDEAGHGEGDGGGPGGDRFTTLLQLIRKFIFASISVVTTLIVLSSLGVDIGPLIAGASVLGIAIGFGAQTLVKDIISGIFFLMDDAFRVGDYIETGSAMGTVEEIGVRSIKLRHHLGFLYTIPYGSMKLVKNNTRDWAVMKLKYLVPFDTDIQKVKKIIKKINKEIRAVPELNEFMLSDIKSQGVKAMEEYGMLMRVKFMTKPGGQFTLRKLVLAKMRKEFAEAGIEFAKPRVSVHLPENAGLTPEEQAQVAAAAEKTVREREEAKKNRE